MAWRRPTGEAGTAHRGRPQALGSHPAGPADAPIGRSSAGRIGPRDPGDRKFDRAGTIVGRRNPVTAGRAVLGGLLIAAAAVLVFATALGAANGRGHLYVVAARALSAGSVIGPGDTATQSMTLPTGTRPLAFTDPSGLIGRRVSVAVGPGALIESPLLAPSSGPAPRPVSIPVDTDSLAGLQPGQAVDVLELVPPASGSGPAASGSGPAAGGSGPAGGAASGSGAAAGSAPGISVVLRGVLLLGVSRPGSGLLPASGSSTVVTLGVSGLDQAEAVVEAAHSGTVELVQAEPGDGTGPATAAG